MNTNMLAIVKKIIAEQGEDILDNPQRLKAFFADLARDEPKPQKNAFVKCVEMKFPQILKNASAAERGECKKVLAKKLHEEEGLDVGLCEEAVEMLVAVLFEETAQQGNACKNCGKELPKEWKSCPYCGMAVLAHTAAQEVMQAEQPRQETVSLPAVGLGQAAHMGSTKKTLFKKTVIAIGVGALLVSVLMVFWPYFPFYSWWRLPLILATLSVFAVFFGPAAGFLIGLIGISVLPGIFFFIDWREDFWWFMRWTDTIRGGWILPGWGSVIFIPLFGLTVGYFRKFYPIGQGILGIKQMLMFNAVQIAAYLVFFPILGMLLDFFRFDLVLILEAIVILIIFATLLLFGYSKIKAGSGNKKQGQTN